MTCPAGCLSLTVCPSASCAAIVFACLPLSHPFRSSASLIRLALLTLPVSRVGGRGVIISFSSRHAVRLPSLRFACPLLGVLTVILNAVAMGTVGCGAFVPRFHKLHLLSIGVVLISSSARRPFFLLSCLPVPRIDKRGDVGRFSR